MSDPIVFGAEERAHKDVRYIYIPKSELVKLIRMPVADYEITEAVVMTDGGDSVWQPAVMRAPGETDLADGITIRFEGTLTP